MSICSACAADADDEFAGQSQGGARSCLWQLREANGMSEVGSLRRHEILDRALAQRQHHRHWATYPLPVCTLHRNALSMLEQVTASLLVLARDQAEPRC